MTQCRTHQAAALGLIASVLSLATTHALAVVRIAATLASAGMFRAGRTPAHTSGRQRGLRGWMTGLPHKRRNAGGRVELDSLTASDLPPHEAFSTRDPGIVLKRVVDVILALAMSALALPLMVLTALAIRIDSKGSILYRQQRVGQFGRPFTLFKFRSMISAAEIDGIPRWALKQDPRITRVGRFIRATRIDELPQLVNVIRGDMSLVGPRPERPHFVEQLAGAIPFYLRRNDVKPGVTGWAQINLPYGASVEDAREKLAYDLYYVKNRSFLLDMMILFSTIRVVALCQGAH